MCVSSLSKFCLFASFRYLHEVCLPSVVHRNFKSANILLDEELNPHLSDCGLAALTPNTERQVSRLGKTTIILSVGVLDALKNCFHDNNKLGSYLVGFNPNGRSIWLQCSWVCLIRSLHRKKWCIQLRSSDAGAVDGPKAARQVKACFTKSNCHVNNYLSSSTMSHFLCCLVRERDQNSHLWDGQHRNSMISTL